MSKYTIIFKYINSDNYENFIFYNNNNRKIRDIKEFINNFDNSICPCMLEAKIQVNFFLGFTKLENVKDETELKLITENSKIFIIQKTINCTCKFLSEDNKKLLSLSRNVLINKIKELNYNKGKDIIENFYDIIININSLINIKNGWQIKFSPNYLKNINILKNKKFGIIGLIGNSNKGKSFILSKLVGTKISPGTNINTEGLCIKYLNTNQNLNQGYIFLDAKGLNEPVLENINNYYDITAKNLFLQNFIIYYSDILLLVIDYLTFSEQKLINQIKNNIRRGNKFKKLIIIHNLKTYRTIKDIKYYINNILLKSFLFKIRKNEKVTSKKDDVIEGEYFTEYLEKYINIFHLIFAAENSEAGNYYNSFAKNFILLHFNNIADLREFDVIENIKSNFSLQSKIYLDQIIKKEDFLSSKEIMEKKLFSLIKSREIKLKYNLFEDLGLQVLEENYFEPKYSIVKTEKYFEIKIELPGNIKVDIYRPIYINNITSINIVGHKYRDKDPKEENNNIIDIRNYGKFHLKINLETQDCIINPNIKYYKFDKGLLILRYEFEKEKVPEKITLSIDEEI